MLTLAIIFTFSFCRLHQEEGKRLVERQTGMSVLLATIKGQTGMSVLLFGVVALAVKQLQLLLPQRGVNDLDAKAPVRSIAVLVGW
jgi:hypothetical protein